MLQGCNSPIVTVGAEFVKHGGTPENELHEMWIEQGIGRGLKGSQWYRNRSCESCLVPNWAGLDGG